MQSRASRAYLDVVRRFPGSDADDMAREELAAFSPDTDIPSVDSLAKKPSEAMRATKTEDEVRTWRSKVGSFSVKAKYLQQREGKVQLQKEDGSKIVVEISSLSDQDQAFLKQQ